MIKDFNRIFRLLSTNFKRGYYLLILLSFIASFLEFFSISLLIPLVSSFTGENQILNKFLSRLGIEGDYSFFSEIKYVILIFLFVYFIKFLFLLFLVFYKNYFIFKLQKDFFLKLYKSYIYRDYLFHLNNNSAKLMRNLLENIQGITVGYLSSINNFILEILIIVSLIILMILFQTKTSLIILFLLSTVVLIVLSYLKKISNKLGTQRQEFYLKHLQGIMQNFEGIKEIKIFLKEKIVLMIGKENLQNLTKNNYLISFINEIPRLFFELIAISSSLMLLYIFINVGFTLETIVTYFVLIVAVLVRLMPSINKIMISYVNINLNKPAVDLVCNELDASNNFFDDKKEEINGGEITFNQKINLSNLSFSYKSTTNKENEIFFNKINLTINKGEMVGLVGKTGSGKSTILNLITGLLQPNTGEVTVDGVNIKNHYKSWLKKIGYVPQNVFLFDADILQNITFNYNDPSFDQKKLDQIIEQSQLKFFLNPSSEGIYTKVGERGSNLSGGQKQRIGIARALYNNSELLILDESTSALDEQTQNQFIEELVKLKGKKTIIISSHNKDTLKYCDKILEIYKGNIREKSI